MKFEVIQIPALQDNYQHLLVCPKSREAVVIDPADAPSVMRVVKREGLKLVAVLNTHHHWDHTGGNDELVARLGLPVYAHPRDGDKIACKTTPVMEGDAIHFGEKISLSVMEIPGHTLGQVAYLGDGRAFVGDTLFLAGCGRIFEGTQAMMFASLKKIAALPPQTLVYGGHEYALQNLRFALTLEPGNADLRKMQELCLSKRERGESTVPTTLAEELSYNPFLRPHSDEIRQSLMRAGYGPFTSDVEVFTATRLYKDVFS